MNGPVTGGVFSPRHAATVAPVATHKIEYSGRMSDAVAGRLLQDLVKNIHTFGTGQHFLLSLAVSAESIGEEGCIVDMLSSTALISARLGANVTVEITLPFPKDKITTADSVDSAALKVCSQWAELALMLARDTTRGIEDIFRHNSLDEEYGAHGKLEHALLIYKRCLEGIIRSIDDGLKNGMDVLPVSMETDKMVRGLRHRISNLSMRLALLTVFIDRFLGTKDPSIAQKIHALLPPHDFPSLWATLRMAGSEAKQREGVAVLVGGPPRGSTLVRHGEWRAQGQLLLLDEILTELLNNASGYAATVVILDFELLPNGDLVIRIRNDVSSPLDRDAVNTLGQAGMMVPGFKRHDSTHMGLFTVARMLDSMRLPPPEFLAEKDGGVEFFVAQIVIPHERLKFDEDAAADIKPQDGWGALPAELRRPIRVSYGVFKKWEEYTATDAVLADATSVEEWVSSAGVRKALLLDPSHFLGNTLLLPMYWESLGCPTIIKPDIADGMRHSAMTLKAFLGVFSGDRQAQDDLLERFVMRTAHPHNDLQTFAKGVALLDRYLLEVAKSPGEAVNQSVWADAIVAMYARVKAAADQGEAR